MAGRGEDEMDHVVARAAEAALDRPAARAAAPPGSRARTAAARRGGGRRRAELVGQSLTWLCGGALALNVLLVVGILALLAVDGLGYSWQQDLVELTRRDGSKVLGEVWEIQHEEPTGGPHPTPARDRIRLKIGNRDVGGLDFVLVDRRDVAAVSRPAGAALLERLEWGNFYGTLRELRAGDRVLARGPRAVAAALGPLLAAKERQRTAIRRLEQGAIGDINYAIERLRLARKRLDRAALPAAERARRAAAIEAEIAAREGEYKGLAERLTGLRRELLAETLVVATAAGATQEMAAGNVLHVYYPNALGTLARLKLYLARAWEFVAADPRESNTEGGIFPAIFGTVMMVFLMSIAVVPLGVLAALYLREYAKQGPLVRLVRIAVNNLAGVPSIVFGVFGLGFFVYLVGGSIDRLFFPDALPTPTFGTGGILWASLTLALLTVPVVIVAAEEGLAAVPRIVREGSLALGATQFETLWRVVLPAAAPGILTGMILAMARAAGEVAPLMIVGMVKLAPALPVDHRFPFVHFERKFMHLGFHIYDVGFQSPNVEATKPLVFATALLLILVVTLTNVAAIALRNRLRRKYAGSAV
jgi:phosphate transport system permease protein